MVVAAAVVAVWKSQATCQKGPIKRRMVVQYIYIIYIYCTSNQYVCICIYIYNTYIGSIACGLTPADGEVERMPQRCHRFHIRELLLVDDRAAALVVVGPAFRSVAAAL